MQYYIIPDSLASELRLKGLRHGNSEDGWLVNAGDLACIGVQKTLEAGGIEITPREARDFIKSL